MDNEKLEFRKSSDIIMTLEEFNHYKTEFNRLEDYNSRLLYFTEKFRSYAFYYFTIFSPNCTEPGCTSEDNYITIYPFNAKEREIYFQMLYDNTSKHKFEEMTSLFEEKLSQSPNKPLFLKRQIDQVKKEIAIYTGTSSQHKTKFHHSIYAAFREGYNSRVEVRSIKFNDVVLLNKNHDYHELIRGSIYAEYEGFLDNYVIDSLNNKHSKIKFNGSPSLFAFLMKELANKGFIQYPLINGETNFTGFGRMLLHHFEVESKEGNVLQEFKPSSSNLSEVKKFKFVIPELKDIK